MNANGEMLKNIPFPTVIHKQIGQTIRELNMLRRMLRLSQTVHSQVPNDRRPEAESDLLEAIGGRQ